MRGRRSSAVAVAERSNPMLDAVFLALVFGFFALLRGAVSAAEQA